MVWNRLTGQETIAKRLGRAIALGKIPHAYLFRGTEGVGKDAAAIEFAKTANCTSPIIENGVASYCGKCSNCLKMGKLEHPNLILVFAMPKGSTAKDESTSIYSDLSDDQLVAVREQLELKAENYYYKLNIPGANKIRIGTIRTLKRALTLSQDRPGRRVAIIFEADMMNPEAANSFLKTLEEPHAGITIILTTSRYDQILPTIKSRCQELNFPRISPAAIERHLIEKKGVSPERAKVAAALSQGSIAGAETFADAEADEIRDDAVSAFRTSLKKGKYRSELFAALAKYFDPKDKSEAKYRSAKFLASFQLWMRDAALLDLGAPVASVANSDKIEVLQKFVGNFRGKDFAGAAEEIDSAAGKIDKNVNLPAVFLSLFVKLRRIFLLSSRY